MGRTRKTVLLIGNCQGQWLASRLLANPAVTAEHDIVYLANFGECPPDHPVQRPGFMGSCDWILWQAAAGTPPPTLLSQASRSCRQFRFPALWLKILWPTNKPDMRNTPEPQFPWGRFPNGDRLVLRLLEKGVPLADIPKAYVETDLNTIVNLERYREITFREMEINDRQSDVAACPLLLRELQDRQLFATINHPCVRMLAHLEHALAATLLGRTPAAQTAAPEDADDYIGSEEVPLHPQIIQFLGLKWAKPGMRWHFRSAFLSLEEYLVAYAAWHPIGFEEPPVLWMERAQQAMRHGEDSKARHLLLTAARLYPGLPQFLQALGTFLIHSGRLEEAEQVLRFALTRHPGLATLHAKLGEVLRKRGFPEAARASLAQAQRMEKGHGLTQESTL